MIFTAHEGEADVETVMGRREGGGRKEDWKDEDLVSLTASLPLVERERGDGGKRGEVFTDLFLILSLRSLLPFLCFLSCFSLTSFV